jgi:lipoate-protein ligase A
MAPSRGFQYAQTTVLKAIGKYRRVWIGRRTFASFSEALANPANKVQSYISRSNDPYLNLSIEHHILQTSPPDAAVLFLYTNRPCVVIGRNQNPWLEVNLGILKALESQPGKETEPPAIGNVDLVRRRSGGGTVFHDEGNVNWSITSQRGDFTRDKHAEMVVRALRKLGVDRARVNERHDIVLDQGVLKGPSDPEDTHRTPYTVDDPELRPLKVSGSAYKLTRARALHHGTCLLASPNLHIIPDYLHSPAKPYLTAKGVESVSSPVGNTGLENDAFQKYVQDEFAAMYGQIGGDLVPQVVGEEQLETPEIRKGYEEMRTPDWMYSQTPQFTLSNIPVNGEGYRNPSSMSRTVIPEGIIINMTVHHGIIKECSIEGSHDSSEERQSIQSALLDHKVQDIRNWNSQLTKSNHNGGPITAAIAKWLSEIMPVVDVSET